MYFDNIASKVNRSRGMGMFLGFPILRINILMLGLPYSRLHKGSPCCWKLCDCDTVRPIMIHNYFWFRLLLSTVKLVSNFVSIG